MKQQQAIDFRIIDKNHFRCYQMQDGTVYYGEVGWVSKEDPTHFYLQLDEVPSENLEDPVEVREKLVNPVRHGWGI